jgi:hypothetical protein
MAFLIVVVVASQYPGECVMRNDGTGERRDQMKGGDFETCIAMIQPVSGQLNVDLLVSTCASAEDIVRTMMNL